MRLRNYWILFIVCTIINKWRKKKCVVSVTPKHGGVLYDSYCNSQCYCQYGCLLLLRCWENMSLSRSTATHKTNKKCNLSRRSTSIQIGSNLIRLSSPIDCYLVHLELNNTFFEFFKRNIINFSLNFRKENENANTRWLNTKDTHTLLINFQVFFSSRFNENS